MQPHEPPTIRHLLERTLAIRDQLTAAHAELTETEVTGHAGSGLVSVTLRGNGEVTSIKIDPAAVNLRDLSGLQDLLVTAFRNANDSVRTLAREKTGRLVELTGGSDDPPRLAR